MDHDIGEADGGEESSVVIFADGFEGAINQMGQGDEDQHVSIGDEGITIVVTPENEQQVSELLRALQASHSEEVQILTESGEDIRPMKIKEEYSFEAESEAVEPPPKRRRGRPPKFPAEAGDTNKKAKLIELALQEADASVGEGLSNLKSSRLREKAAKQGGLKKLWLSVSKDDSEDETVNVEGDHGELKSDGEYETHKCEVCPEVTTQQLEQNKLELHRTLKQTGIDIFCNCSWSSVNWRT